MCNNSFINKILIVASVLFLYSCDKDYNSVGGDLLGENHFDLNKEFYDVLAYSQKTGAVQSNNLPINALGIYDNANFGTTTANFATQLTLEALSPTIGKNPVIESVVLTIPYFSTLKSTDEKGDHVYELDSIYGPADAKIKLSVYESKYFMRNLDPVGGFQDAQKYFTDQNTDFDNLKGTVLLNDAADDAQNNAFFFSPAEYKVTTTVDGKETVNRTAPGMRLNLNANFFKTKIIDAATSGKLATNEVFKDYFRGLYFKVEKSGSNAGALAMLDFKKGKITIKYKEDTSDTDATKVEKEIVINMTGNTVSLLSNDFTVNGVDYGAAPNKGDDVNGDKTLYLKGGDGAMAVIELFNKTDVKGYDANGNLTGPNGISDELDDLRNPQSGTRKLINEANLVFHIDEIMSKSKEPMRVYLYDLDNNTPLVDFYADATTGSNSKNGQVVFGGLLDNTKAGDGVYKIRITNHVRNLIKDKTAKNVKLGLVVTEDVTDVNFYKLKNAASPLLAVPRSAVMSPLGTVLHGSNKQSVPDAKRLKFEMYYTKSN
ncbi:DUF4270 domain-containing protein [Flavobacterium granuli]|uniref:Uncharacterized protein DUF4270 n=1 Tax=Flavobacterium granuli TaxID=280093 RepID=A0A1M5K121_9FLAO|nr:DUF4270 domain-containing protein [Flavobacterium granuli]PRZ26130.1 uncharacterized protein DUF4270 [Flavobacterium granuli]SHG46552.1 protein of unknown function [Flavobacterium granuli]